MRLYYIAGDLPYCQEESALIPGQVHINKEEKQYTWHGLPGGSHERRTITANDAAYDLFFGNTGPADRAKQAWLRKFLSLEHGITPS
jgi:hypothetical protein